MGMRDYCVYEHVFPNGKRYIGITCSQPPEKRWNGGRGYKAQTKVRKAIDEFGWENVSHNILVEGLDMANAEKLEKYLIASLGTIGDGYNATAGGTDGCATYLSEYLLEQCIALRRYAGESFDATLAAAVYADRFDKEKADDWNGVEQAVTDKWRVYSRTDVTEVVSFWWHMSEYVKLSNAIQDGVQIFPWVESCLACEKFTPETQHLTGMTRVAEEVYETVRGNYA